MLLEFPVCPFRRPDCELVPKDLKDQFLHRRLDVLFALVDDIAGCLGRRHLYAKNGALLGHGLDGIRGGDDVEDEARVLDDDAFGADPPDTAAPDHLNLGAMEIRGGQLRGGSLATSVQFGTQYVAHVAEPEIVQRQEGGVLVAIARDLVQGQLAAKSRGQGLGLEGSFAVLQVALALGAAGLFRGGEGRGRGWAQQDGAVLNLVRVDAVGGDGGVGPREERLGDGRRLGCHVCMSWVVVVIVVVVLVAVNSGDG